MKKLIIHTDGSCNNKTQVGGWGAVIRMQDSTKSKRLCGGYTGTTNNQMEMLAVIHALEWVSKKGEFEIELYSDSQYVIKGITNWIYGWKRRGWKSSQESGEVKNKDLWIRLDQLKQKHLITFNWVRGHAGDIFNEEADQLANKGANYKG